jgi:hypothetical protein
MLLPSPLLLPRGCLLLRTLRLLLLPGLLGTLRLLLRSLLLRLLGPLLLGLLSGPGGLLLLLLLLLRLLLRPLLLRLLGPLLLWLLGGPGGLLLLRLLLRPLLLRLLGPLLLWLLGGPGGLLLRPLLLRLLGPLLLWLLSGPSGLLLLPACLLLLRLSLRTLLLCGWRTLLFRRLALFIAPLAMPRIRRDNRPEEQKHGGAADSSNELHSDVSPLRSLVPTGYSRVLPLCALAVWQRLGGFRLGLGLLHRPIRVIGRRVERR